jgi:hypothetical protein
VSGDNVGGKEHTVDGSVLLVVVSALEPGLLGRDMFWRLTEFNEGVSGSLHQCLPYGQLSVEW